MSMDMFRIRDIVDNYNVLIARELNQKEIFSEGQTKEIHHLTRKLEDGQDIRIWEDNRISEKCITLHPWILDINRFDVLFK